MITGVSLKGADAVVVLLGQTETFCYPISLGISGQYNRVGGIDQPAREDANMRLVLNHFRSKQRNGELDIATPFANIYELLSEFAEYIDWDDASGRIPGAIVYALICGAIWDAIADSAPVASEPTTLLFDQLFAATPEAQEIYSGNLADLAGPVRELAAVNSFMARREIAWTPPELPNQDWPEDMRAYLATARQTYQNVPTILAGLDAYEAEVARLLVDAY
jgi:hypothetical protein